jgi:hypothetical protein
MTMKYLKNLLLIYVFFVLASCEKKVQETELNSVATWLKSDGVFVINEGNYLAGNGTLSFYSYDSAKLFNNLFFLANSRPLGDVPNSMVISGNKGYLVVNNSGKIEVVDKNTMISLKTIDGLVSPRNMAIIGTEKAYVSSLYSNSLTILDLNSNTVKGSIKIRRSSEAMVSVGTSIYVSSWYSGNEVLVINTATDLLIDSVVVAPEPESMVVDKNNKLWVLCSGGYTGQKLAEMVIINTTTNRIEKEYIFPSKSNYPSSLQINGTRDTIYWIDNGIWRMSIQSQNLPAKQFKQSNGRLIYKLGVDPGKGRIFYSDALDYQQKGYVLQLTPEGRSIDSCRSDIIPGSFYFK